MFAVSPSLRFLAASTAALTMGCGANGPPPEATPKPSSLAGASYERLIRGAQAQLDQGNAKRAVPLLEEAIAKEPEKPKAYAMLGRGLAALGKLEEAVKRYEEARARGITSRRTFLELASIYDISQRYEDAAGVYRHLIQQNPKDVEAQHELGLTLLLAGRPPEAVTELTRAKALDPQSAPIQADLAYAHLEAGAVNEAKAELDALLAAQPNNSNALQLRARIQTAEGDLTGALSSLNQAIAVSRTDPRPVRARAQLRRQTGDNEGALSDYRMLTQADPRDAASWLGTSGALIALDRLEEATESLDQAETIAGPQPPVRFRRAQIAWRQGDAQAIETIAEFARARPEILRAWEELLLAATRYRRGPLIQEAKTQITKLKRR